MHPQHPAYVGLAGILACLVMMFASARGQAAATHSAQIVRGAWEDEVFYQIFPRSFYDSNGDSTGDLNGIRQKLDYLQDLGITGIWVTPILKARCYHNYYADSFDSLDPAFGTWDEWIALVKELHSRKMKIFIDMEPQYVANHHPWYRDAYNNPTSKYSSYLRFTDSLNRQPVVRKLGTYNKADVGIIGIRMNNPGVRDAITNLFRRFADPEGNGSLAGGVDGFRIDHIMDDLDHKGMDTNLFTEFWKPIFTEIRRINPAIFFLGEQADWGFGKDALTRADCDGVFAYPQWWGTTTFNKLRLTGLIDTTWMNTPPGKHQFTFIENHDVDRYASAVNGEPGKMRIGAALNILLKGVPCLYYGQEIGMRGKKGEWHSDGNDIPLREAFHWSKSLSAPGMALWYANTGPWWENSSLRGNDGASLEEQKNDPRSLWHYYKQLIALRTSSPALRRGTYAPLMNNNDSVVSFYRYEEGKPASGVLVVINLSRSTQKADLALAGHGIAGLKELKIASPKRSTGRTLKPGKNDKLAVSLDGYAVRVYSCR